MNGWKTVTIDEVATIERSAVQPGAIRQGTAYLGLEHIESGGKILGAKPVDEGELASSKFKFTEHHVLYGKLRPYLAKISCPDFSGICSTDILPILPGPDLERRFLCHFLRQTSMVDYANSRATGANLPRLSPSALANFEIPLPPLAEQQRIAKVLDQAEALRAKRRAALSQLDALTQSIFLDLFGDPAANPKNWQLSTLKELGKVTTGGTPSSAKEGMFDGPIPFVTPGDLESDKPVKRSVTEAGAKEIGTIRQGATLVCCIGATIGKIGMTRVRSAFNQQLNSVEWRDLINDSYGYWALRFFKPTIISWGASTTLPILKKSAFERIEIPVPPVELQKEFARRLQAVDDLSAAYRASLDFLDELFHTLQYRAFRGEL